MSEGNDFVQYVLLILLMPGEPVPWRTPVTVKTLGVYAIDAAELEPAIIDLVPQSGNESPVFVIVEPSDAGRENDHPRTTLSKNEKFHFAAQIRAMPSMIFSMHAVRILASI
jgi:hypothetical protein